MLKQFLEIVTTQFVRIRGNSMAPTLRPGSWISVSRRAYRRGAPQRFDIVKLRDPSRSGRWVIKRVVGLPGENVRIENGRLTVNGQEVAEPYVGSPGPLRTQEWWLRQDEYLVLGDNRDESSDSRRYGPIRLDSINGKVRRKRPF